MKLAVVVEVALTKNVSEATLSELKTVGITLKEMIEDDYITQSSLGGYLTRPQGRKLLGRAIRLLVKASTTVMEH